MRPRWCLTIMHSNMFGKNEPQRITVNFLPAVKDIGAGVIIWACFVATGAGKVAVTVTPMNTTLYYIQNILKTNVRPCVQQLNLDQNWVMQPDIDLKHTSNSPYIYMAKEFKIRVQSRPQPHYDAVEGVKREVHKSLSLNHNSLKQEWDKLIYYYYRIIIIVNS